MCLPSGEYSTASAVLCGLLGHSWLCMCWPSTVKAKPPDYLTMPERRDVLEEWRTARAWRDALERADAAARETEAK
jgi:hypothetical protein